MNALRDAIKNRRTGGLMAEGHHEAGGADLHGLLAKLSPDQKEELKDILNGDSKTEHEIVKGGPSSEEKAQIESSIQEENAEHVAEDADNAVDSDEIGLSMLDSRYTGQNHQPKARNLGERVKQNIANNLKAKGKI